MAVVTVLRTLDPQSRRTACPEMVQVLGDAWRPSPEDRAATARLERAGRILGVPLLDHVVVADSGFFSFREDGGLKG